MTISKRSSEESPGGSGPRPPSAAPKRLAILIIDDNFDYADSLRYLFEHYGHHADFATDGPSGLRLASTGTYDAIVCDIGLPGMSGYEIAQRLRSERATAGVPMVAVTAYGSAEAKRQAFAAGFDAHVVKPASVADILSGLGIRVSDITALVRPAHL